MTVEVDIEKLSRDYLLLNYVHWCYKEHDGCFIQDCRIAKEILKMLKLGKNSYGAGFHPSLGSDEKSGGLNGKAAIGRPDLSEILERWGIEEK